MFDQPGGLLVFIACFSNVSPTCLGEILLPIWKSGFPCQKEPPGGWIGRLPGLGKEIFVLGNKK
jgi:hypothetical protein